MCFRRILISVLALAAVVPASATTLYCNEVNTCNANTASAFNSATAGLFFGAGFQILTAADGSYPLGITDANGITGLNFFGYDSSHNQIGVTIGSGVVRQTTGGGGTSLQVQFPPNTIFAFAAHISVVSGSATPCIESINDVSSFNSGGCLGDGPVLISGTSDSEFIGVVNTSPLASVFIGCTSGSCGPLDIQDFELGTQPAATPEAATLVLIGSGLICLRLIRRRQKKARP